MKITLVPLTEFRYSLDEIKKIEQKIGFKLPLIYRDFLLECGHSKVITKNRINKQISEGLEIFLRIMENDIKYNEHGLVFALSSLKREIVLNFAGEIFLMQDNKKAIRIAAAFEEFLDRICIPKKKFLGFNL